MTQLNEHQTRWLNALRGGTYTQGYRRMVTLRVPTNGDFTQLEPDGYCCLGVYAHCTHGIDAFQRHGDTVDSTSRPHLKYLSDDGEYVDGDLTNQDLENLGLTHADLETLVAMNDSHEYTFNDIATLLEAHWGRSYGSDSLKDTYEDLIEEGTLHSTDLVS